MERCEFKDNTEIMNDKYTLRICLMTGRRNDNNKLT